MQEVEVSNFPEIRMGQPDAGQGGLLASPVQTLLRLDQLGSVARLARRDIAESFQEARAMVHLDKAAAESCTYSLPRGGKTITGPSVRLAEIMHAAWGNITVSIDSFTVEHDQTSGRVSVKVWGWALDAQKNNAVQSFESASVFPKKDGRGGYKPVSDDDIANAIDRARAMLYRDLIFKVIPKAYTNVIHSEAIGVALGGAVDLATKVDRVLERFRKAWGVPENAILAYLRKPNRTTLDSGDVEQLMGLGTAIKEGHTTIEAVFASTQPANEPAGQPESLWGGREPGEEG